MGSLESDAPYAGKRQWDGTHQAASPLDLAFLGFVLVLATNTPRGLFELGGPPPILLQLLFTGFGGLMVLGRAVKERPILDGTSIGMLWPLLVWLLAWVILSTLGVLMSGLEPSVIDYYIIRLKSPLILLLLLVGVSQLERKDLFPKVLAVAAVVNALIVIYDFFVPTFSTVLNRAAGFFVNANGAGSALVLTMAAGLLGVPPRWRLAYVALLTFAVVVTFSRSSWLALMMATVILFWQGHVAFRRQRRVIGFVALSAIGLIGLSIVNGSLADVVAATPLADYLDENTLARLGFGEFASDFSAEERRGAFVYSLETFRVTANPILGEGLGHTIVWDYRVGPHNMFLLYLVEHGLVGLVFYLALMGILIARSRGPGLVMALGVVMFSSFTHNLLDSPWRLVMIAFIVFSPLYLPEDRDRAS